MSEPAWLTTEMVVAAHARQLRRFGGLDGLRDKGALESALARPLNQFAYGETDIVRLAAAYGETDIVRLAAAYGFGLARNHAFADGNKRVSFIATALFLAMNGLRLRASQEDVVETFLGLAAGRIDEAKLADWIRAHIEQAP